MDSKQDSKGTNKEILPWLLKTSSSSSIFFEKINKNKKNKK